MDNSTQSNTSTPSQKGKRVAKSYKRAIAGVSGGAVALLLTATVLNATPPVEMRFLVKEDTVVCQVQVNDEDQSYALRLDGYNVEEIVQLSYGENQAEFVDLLPGTYMLSVVIAATNEVVTTTRVEIVEASSARLSVWMNLLLDKAY